MSIATIIAKYRPAAFGGAGINSRGEADFVASHYRYNRHVRGLGAVDALRNAKELPAAYVKGREYYGPSGTWGAPFTRHGDTLRYVENWQAAGLRFVGYADEMRGLRYTGWYTDDDNQDSTLRGAVWQLPGNGKASRLVYGYQEFEGKGEMNEGSACICISDMRLAPMAGAFGNLDETDEARDMASAADGLAESMAEDERDYRRTYERGREAAEHDNAIAVAKAALRPLVADMRANRAELDASRSPALVAALKTAISGYLETISEKRAARDSAWADCPSCDEKAWLAGFMDGADGQGFVRAVRLGWMKASDWKGAPDANPCLA